MTDNITSFPWIELTDRMPNPDEHSRVLIYTEDYAFNGEQVLCAGD